MSGFAVHGAFILAKNLYCADINIDISFTTYYFRITTVKFAIYTAVMRKDGKTLCSKANGFYKELHYECCAFSCGLSLKSCCSHQLRGLGLVALDD